MSFCVWLLRRAYFQLQEEEAGKWVAGVKFIVVI
jgi:hypothetical protein